MKTLIAITTVAVLAIAFFLVEASQNNREVRQHHNKCPERDPPPINTTEAVKCERRRPSKKCINNCKNCYNSTQLKDEPWACVVRRVNCQCLGRPNTDNGTTTEGPSSTSESTDVTAPTSDTPTVTEPTATATAAT